MKLKKAVQDDEILSLLILARPNQLRGKLPLPAQFSFSVTLENECGTRSFASAQAAGLRTVRLEEKTIPHLRPGARGRHDERPILDRGTKGGRSRKDASIRVACPAGVEPATYCLEGSCSIQLSYGQRESRSKRQKKRDVNDNPFSDWSEYKDSNLGPPAPKAGALPGCATLRRPEL